MDFSPLLAVTGNNAVIAASEASNSFEGFPPIHAMAGPVYILFMLIEHFYIKRGTHREMNRGTYTKDDSFNSIALGIGSTIWGVLLTGSIGAATYALYMWLYQYRLIDIPIAWWSFALVFLLDDLRYYWSHRWAHKVRWYWADHVVHHSSTRYNLSTALRQPWFGFLTMKFWTMFPLILLGFHPAFASFVFGINLIYQFFIHTQTVGKLHPWIEFIMNTPSHHRVHHGRNPRYLDANFAGVFIIWDRMFGSFVPETDKEVVDYGLVVNTGTENPFKTAVHEYAQIAKDQFQGGLSFWQRLLYLFAPPGYSHDGSRKSSKMLKEDYVRQNPSENGAPGLPYLEGLEAEKKSDENPLFKAGMAE